MKSLMLIWVLSAIAFLLPLAGCDDSDDGATVDESPVSDDDQTDDDQTPAPDDDQTDDDAVDDDVDDDAISDDDSNQPEPPAENLRAITFNLRTGFALDGPDSWIYRKDIAASFVQDRMPDVMGIQEGWKFQLDYIKSQVSGYDWVGVSRMGNSYDEYSAVFYRTDKYSLLDGGTFWLSDTPDKPRSEFSPNQLFPRIVTWIKLESFETGRKFFVFNTHFDTYTGESVHEKSAALFVNRKDSLAGDAPALATGDFNDPAGGAPYRILTGENTYDGETGDFIDPWIVLGLPEEGTFHGFDGIPDSSSRIDWILATDDFEPIDAQVSHYNVDNRYPSDHFPVGADFVFGQ